MNDTSGPARREIEGALIGEASTACAALWLPRPETALPRRAPEPQTSTDATSVCTPHAGPGCRAGRGLGPRATRGRRGRCGRLAHARSPLDVLGILASGNGRLAASVARQLAIGSTRCSSSAERTLTASCLALGVALEERGVHPEVGQRAHVRRCLAEDRVVGEGVAADLAGHDRRHPAGRRRRTPPELAVVPRPGAASRRRRARLTPTSAGEPVEQQADLQLRTLGLAVGLLGLAEQDAQHPRGDVEST